MSPLSLVFAVLFLLYSLNQGSLPEPIDSTLQSRIEGRVSELSGSYGVAVRDLQTGRTVLINPGQTFPAASTYKLLLMYRAYQQIEDGLLDPDDMMTVTAYDSDQDDPYVTFWPGEVLTVEEAIEASITMSSNAAAHALARAVGGWSSVVLASDEMGMSRTYLEDGYFYTTPSDLLAFLDALGHEQLVSAEASRSMIALLSRQRLNGRIPALLPEGTVTAHKTGELDGVRNDVGIVYGPTSGYIVIVLTEGVDVEEADNFIASIALDAFEYYEGHAAKS